MENYGVPREDYEIIVSDSSTDNSVHISQEEGAKIVKHEIGYGQAYLRGFQLAKGEIILMGDSDNTYDFLELPKLLAHIEENDFVIGIRKNIKKGAMPLLHKYLGNPLLSGLLRLFFKTKIRDAHCGLRIIKKEKLDSLNLKTTGMEFASEMIIKALQTNLKIKQVPISYYPRLGESNLKSFRDGWRHLRFMLMFAPDYLFLIPGFLLFFIGIIIMLIFLQTPVNLFGITLYNRPIFLGSFFTILGFQVVMIGLFAKAYMKSIGLIKEDKTLKWISRHINFESGILAGGILLLVCLFLTIKLFIEWYIQKFPEMMSNDLIFLFTLAIIAVNMMFSTFFISIMLVHRDGK